MKNKPLFSADMLNFLKQIAEIGSQSGMFWDYSQPPTGELMVAGVIFLVIVCLGIALDVALVMYLLKRPVSPSAWTSTLASRSLSGRMVLLTVLTLVALYIANSLAYGVLFPNVYQAEPSTLLFQTLFFHLPAFIVLFGILRGCRKAGEPQLGCSWRKAPAMLGLSFLLYLAAIPVLWFYSMLYQLLLQQMGQNLYLQDVAQVFLMAASTPERIAMFFIAIVVAPVFEEIVFRGILFPWVVRRAGLWTGVVAVSTVFAIMHFHVPSLLPLFLLSAFFCIAYARTRSLLVPIGMHALFNGISLLLLTLMG